MEREDWKKIFRKEEGIFLKICKIACAFSTKTGPLSMPSYVMFSNDHVTKGVSYFLN